MKLTANKKIPENCAYLNDFIGPWKTFIHRLSILLFKLSHKKTSVTHRIKWVCKTKDRAYPIGWPIRSRMTINKVILIVSKVNHLHTNDPTATIFLELGLASQHETRLLVRLWVSVAVPSRLKSIKSPISETNTVFITDYLFELPLKISKEMKLSGPKLWKLAR